MPRELSLKFPNAIYLFMSLGRPCADRLFQAWQAVLISLVVFTALPGFSAGTYFEVSYPGSTESGQLKCGVTYTLWIPEHVTVLRAVIVHQHGCGQPACEAGGTAAYDLHWQALARKWDAALLGPSYHQTDKEDCTIWCDPRNGSERAFLQALKDLALKSGHPELDTAPWCLWGHSGGGYWVGEMQLRYPERIVAVWQRSGAGRFFRKEDPVAIPAAAFQVPVMCNPGVKEKTNQFARIWTGMLEEFKTYRLHGAPIGFAPDPRTSHECGDSRYLAIPFFDACLRMRLPTRRSTSQTLRPVDMKQAWLAPLLGRDAVPAQAFSGKPDEAVWLPNAAVAKAWSEYVRTGHVGDSTPPPAPFNVTATRSANGAIELTWDAEADFESGLGGFIVERDGLELGRLPEKPVGRFGRPLFQTMSFHDTPEKPLPPMRFVDRTCQPGKRYTYAIKAVNSVGLESKAIRAGWAK